MKALLDTSVVVATDVGRLEEELGISAATLSALHFGVLVAADPTVRAEWLWRLSTPQRRFNTLPIDKAVAASYGAIVKTCG